MKISKNLIKNSSSILHVKKYDDNESLDDDSDVTDTGNDSDFFEDIFNSRKAAVK